MLAPELLYSNWTIHVNSDPENVPAKAFVFHSFSNEHSHTQMVLLIAPELDQFSLALTSMTLGGMKLHSESAKLQSLTCVALSPCQ